MIGQDDIIGITGTITLILAYTMTTYKLSNNLILIDFLNVYGSFGVGYNCIYKKTYPPLILEIVWFIIGIISIFKNIRIYYSKKNKYLSQSKDLNMPLYYQSI